jgi:hypothetical protein
MGWKEELSRQKRGSELDLTSMGLNDAAAKAVAEELAHNTSVTDVFLAYNQIGDVGALELRKALLSNSTVRFIEMSKNKVSATLLKEVEELAKQADRCPASPGVNASTLRSRGQRPARSRGQRAAAPGVNASALRSPGQRPAAAGAAKKTVRFSSGEPAGKASKSRAELRKYQGGHFSYAFFELDRLVLNEYAMLSEDKAPRPSKTYAIEGATTITDACKRTGERFSFELKSLGAGKELVLVAGSREQYREWFKRVKRSTKSASTPTNRTRKESAKKESSEDLNSESSSSNDSTASDETSESSSTCTDAATLVKSRSASASTKPQPRDNEDSPRKGDDEDVLLEKLEKLESKVEELREEVVTAKRRRELG